MPNEDIYTAPLTFDSPEQEDIYTAPLTFDEPGGEEEDIYTAPLTFDEPAKPLTEPGKAWAKKPSDLYQAPLLLPGEEPPPEKPKVPIEFGMGYMIPGPIYKPGVEYPSLGNVATQAKLGLVGLWPDISRNMQRIGGWLFGALPQSLARGIAEQQVPGQQMPGAWAPPLGPELAKKNRELYESLAKKFDPIIKHFEETANVPGEYLDALDVISQNSPGPQEIKGLVQTFGTAIPAVAVAPVGFPAMIAMSGLQQAGDTYAQSYEMRRERGESEEEARRHATGDGLISGIITAVVTAGAGRTGKEVLTAAKKDLVAKGVIMRLAKEAGYEGAEEVVDQFLQSVYEWMTYNPDKTVEEAVKEILMAGVGGVLIGGGVSGTFEGSAAIDRVTKNRAELKQFREEIRRLVEFGPEAQLVSLKTKSVTGDDIRVMVPVQPSPVRGTAQEIMPRVADIQGAQAVNQALSVGLTSTAQQLAEDAAIRQAALRGQPADVMTTRLTAGQEPGVPTTPTQQLQGRERAAREVAQTIPLRPAPAPTQAAVPTPAAEAAPTAQPTPQAEAAVAPTAAPEAAGVSPAQTTRPSVTQAPVTEPTAPLITEPQVTQESLGLKTNLERDFPWALNLVEVVDEGSQLPDIVKQDLAERGIQFDDADAVYSNGRVIFNAKKFPVGDRLLVREKVTHEVGIHLGLRQALGPTAFTALVNRVYRTLSPNDRADVAARNRIPTTDIYQIGEEWLAYEAERVARWGVVTPFWRRVANKIRQVARAMRIPGWSKRAYSDYEIADMISKGIQRAQRIAESPAELQALREQETYPPGSPLSSINTIRYSYADVRGKTSLAGAREYVPPTEGMNMEDAFKTVQDVLYREGEALSDLVDPRENPWQQPREGQSLIEYIRKFYSPEGIAAIRKTLDARVPPDYVVDKNFWYAIKAEYNRVFQDIDDPNSSIGANFLASNSKAGGVSWDFGLGTCMPSEGCAVCYAKGLRNPAVGVKSRVRHSLVTAMEPEKVGTHVARFIRNMPKEEQAFLRINGAGDTTFPWQAVAVNQAIKELDRPVHIFSRSHVSRAPGTIGLDSISNGQYDRNDVENGVAVFKMGSIDRQLYREYIDQYGIDFLKNNLAERGIVNSYLVRDVDDIPVLLEARRAGVPMVLHINRTNEVVNALAEAKLINDPEGMLNTPACYCALESGPSLNGCATCLVGGGPCFALGSTIAMTPDGQLFSMNDILSGKVEPPVGPLVEMSRVGLPANRAKMQAAVAAKSYEMAASKLDGSVSKFNSGKVKSISVSNPRSMELLWVATTKDQARVVSRVANSWRQYANFLRNMDTKYADSAGFHRIFMAGEIAKELSLDQALTEGVNAAKRAVQKANSRYSVTSGQPRLTVDQVGAMDAPAFAEWARTIPDGITGEAVRLGRTMTTPDQVDQLRQQQAEAKALSQELMQAGDFDNAMAAATKSQFFREAMEVATGTGSMQYAAETGRLNDASAWAQPHNASEEGPPPPTSGLEEHDKDYTTRYSISRMPDPNFDFLAIRNADMDKALGEMGHPPMRDFLGKPDQELLDTVQRRIARDPTWVDSIVDREQKRPGMLSDEEVLALDYWMLELRTEIWKASKAAEAAESKGLVAEAAAARAQVDFWGQALVQLREITTRSGTLTARAFRARQLALKWDFTPDVMYHTMRQAQGWKRLSRDEKQELFRRVEKEARKYQELSIKLDAQIARLQQAEANRTIGEAEDEVARVNPEVMKFAEEWVKSYQNSAKTAKERINVKWKRLFPQTPLRFSVAEGPTPLPEEVLRDLAIIGGSKLAQNITDRVDWNEAMVEELGPNISPYLDQVWPASQQDLTTRLTRGRADLASARASRVVERPARTQQEMGPEQIVESAMAKFRQIQAHEASSTEPVGSRQSELYYPTQRLVRGLVELDPLMTRDELTQTVHRMISEVVPRITIEETRDLISGRGRVREPAQDDVSKTIRDLKAQIRIFSNILDAEAKRPIPKTGWLADEKSDEQLRLERDLNRAKKINGEVITDAKYQQKTYLDSRKTWYRNRITDLRWEMDPNNWEARERMRAQREDRREQTDEELEALKEEYDRVREEYAQIFEAPGLTDLQRIERAERAAERMITKMEEDLVEGRRTSANKRDPVTSAKLEALRARIAQLRAEQEWAQREINPPPDLTTKEDYKRWFQLDREIRKLENQLANQDVFPKSKKIRPEDKPSNQRMAARLEDLKNQRKEMRERLGPGKPDPVTKAINLRVSQLRRQIADYKQRIADQDFSPRRRKEPPKEVTQNRDVIDLTAQRERIQRDFYNQAEAERIKNLTGMKKVWYGIRRMRTAVTNLRSSYDFSGSRQGIVALLSLGMRLPTSPIKTTPRIARAFIDMFKAASSRARAERINAAIRRKPNYESGAYKIMGIEFTDIESPTFNRAEENARSVFDEWANMGLWGGKSKLGKVAGLPFRALAIPVAGSNRAFATFLNVLRSELADVLLQENFSDRPPTENELRILGNWVNVATGRGYVPPAAARGFSEFIWAPKLLMSRVQFLTGQPLWGAGDFAHSKRARWIVAKEYARVLSSAAFLYLISTLFDDKDEVPPTSSDFMKIVRGNTRIDLWGGFIQPIVLASRILTNSTTTLKGRTIDFDAANAYGVGNLVDVLVRFGRSKLRPDIGVALDIISREDFLGRPTNIPNIMRDLFVPLPFADIVDIYKARGFSEGTILTILNIFGAGVNTYTDDNKYPRETRTR